MLLLCVIALAGVVRQNQPDLILHHGRIVTVDQRFRIAEAMAVRGGRILAVGADASIRKLRTPATQMIDLKGRMVLPGLMDSHTHPAGASLTEFDHQIPTMETIADVLAYVRSRAAALGPGRWIEVRQVFITRLKEQRYPTRKELDEAAPQNPVLFATGPDAALNSLALKLSGIDRNFTVSDGGPGHAEKDPQTGEPTGIIRGMTRLVKVPPPERRPTVEQRLERLELLFQDYNANGITAIGDRDAAPEALALYRSLRDSGRLSVRISASHHLDTIGPPEEIQAQIRKIAAHPLRARDPWLQIIGVKTFLDGGMLTGSAYMRRPWGVSRIYSISDASYRGVLLIPPDRLLPIVRTTVESGLQFTAHAVGDGAVHTLLDAYREVNRTTPVRITRPCITHCNFMSPESVAMLAEMGVSADIQPAWLYLDARTLTRQFGYDRLRWFQPLKSLFRAGAIAGGGSDHMQKIGGLRSVNPYNPFLAMWTAITRKAKGYDGRLHPQEAISREDAVRFYTRNNAHILFRDEAGSLEPGKLADFIILDRDILRCPVDDIRNTRVLATYVDGKRTYAAPGY